MPQGQKIFVLDTSVIVHDPDALQSFQNNIVVIPYPVIYELDGLKTGENGRGFSARSAIRFLRGLLERHGSLERGVPLDNGGTLFVEREALSLRKMPVKKLAETSDSRIAATAKVWQIREAKKASSERRQVILVTKDGALALTADACGLMVQDYLTDRGVRSVSDLPTGHKEVFFSGDHKACLSKFHRDRLISIDALEPYVGKQFSDVRMNTCITLTLKDGRGTQAIFRGDHLRLVPYKANQANGPRNLQQAFAEFLVAQPDLSIVALNGRAGTGKTFIALLAGLRQLGDSIQKIQIYRPNIPIGRDLGFLPGDLGDKFQPWTLPIYDNLEAILFSIGKRGVSENGFRWEKPEDLFSQETITVSPINFVRGRSIAHSLIIVDECQNLTPHEVKTLISRAGAGTKFVLTGDLGQIDNPFLDPLTNGLAHVIKRLSGQSTFGHILLTQGERSELAEMAARFL